MYLYIIILKNPYGGRGGGAIILGGVRQESYFFAGVLPTIANFLAVCAKRSFPVAVSAEFFGVVAV